MDSGSDIISERFMVLVLLHLLYMRGLILSLLAGVSRAVFVQEFVISAIDAMMHVLSICLSIISTLCLHVVLPDFIVCSFGFFPNFGCGKFVYPTCHCPFFAIAFFFV